METAYAAWRTFQDKVLARLAASLLVGCTLLALLEVGRRYLFGRSFEWQQDAVTFIMLSGVYLYFSVAQRKGSHLAVTVVPELCAVAGPRAQLVGTIVKTIALAFSMVFLGLVFWWGIPEVEDAIKYETRTESLGFPMWPFLLALLLGFGFMAITQMFQLWFAIQKLLGRPVPEYPEDADEGGH
ncbi:MAG: TRAP transporter small permease [Burkholderiales bacterium]